MKNRITLFLAMLFLYSLSHGQKNYKVLYTYGKVFANDTLLKKGTLFKSTDKIVFKSKKGVLKVCFNNCSKIKVIHNFLFRKTRSKTVSDFITYYKPLGIRGDRIVNLLDFKDLLEIQKLGVIDTLEIFIKNFHLEINRDNFFYVRYQYLNDTINKKLRTSDSNLLITKSAFKIKGIGYINANSIPLSLFHLNQTEKKSTLIIPSFQLVFLDERQLRREIINLFEKDDPSISSNDKIEIIKDFIKLEYPEIYLLNKDLKTLID